MNCNIQDMDFSPPLIVNPYKLNDQISVKGELLQPNTQRWVNVIDDGKLLGGTKQRALIKFIEYYSDYDEFVYAGPSIGFAQVALTMACVKMNKRITFNSSSCRKFVYTGDSKPKGIKNGLEFLFSTYCFAASSITVNLS